MALATQCPHCGKRFRVAADQLKLRGGIVRCGACHEIFDGNATLIDLDALAAQPPAPAPTTSSNAVVPAHAGTHAEIADTQPEPEPAASEPEAPSPVPDTHDLDGEPIYTLDFDHTFDPFGILPKAEETAPAPAQEAADIEHPDAHLEPEPEPDTPPRREPVFEAADATRLEPTLGLPVDEELIAAALPEHEDFESQPAMMARPALHTPSGPLPMRESAPAEPLGSQPRPPVRTKAAEAKANRRSKLTPTKIAPPKLRVPEIDEPEFVKRSRQQEQSGKVRRILMTVGSVVLLLALAAQGIVTFRNELAARFPGARGALLGACTVLRCRVELPTRIDRLTIEQGELTALGGNTYLLATLLHNQDSLVQAWPHIELTLSDTNEKPLLRRVFAPAEYLPQGTPAANGFAARAEQPVKLYFQLDQLKPSGYSIAVFYP